MSGDASRRIRFDVAIVGLLWLTETLSGLASVVHTDLSRDVFAALQIVRGGALPMAGPILAGTIHTGPLWFYLLSVPLALTHSWPAIGLFIGFLAGCKFPLAYAVGTRLFDRRFGLLLAALMTLPGWGTIEVMLASHTSLIVASFLLLALCVQRFHAVPGRARAALVGVAAALAVHAHPSMAGVVALAAIGFSILSRRCERPLQCPAFAIVGFLVPFAPYLAEQQAAGWTDLASGASYLASNTIPAPLQNLWQMWLGIAITGPRYVAKYALRLPDPASWLLYAVLLATWAGAAAGLVRLVRNGDRWHWPIAAVTAFIVLSGSIVLLRPLTPFYMVYPLLPVLAFIAALGLRGLGSEVARPAIARAAAVLLAIQFVAVTARAAMIAERGAWDLELLNVYEVKNRVLGNEGNVLLMPVTAMRQSGRLLCESNALAVHGSYAFHLRYNYGLERILACGSAAPLSAGGTEASARHILGLSWTLASRAFAPQVVKRVGPVAIVEGVTPHFPARGFPMVLDGAYPPFVPSYGDARSVDVTFDEAPRSVVVVTNLFPYSMPPPAIAVAIDGQRVEGIGGDGLTMLYRCADCGGDRPARWRLTIAASDPDRIDVVAVASTAVPRQAKTQ